MKIKVKIREEKSYQGGLTKAKLEHLFKHNVVGLVDSNQSDAYVIIHWEDKK
jgi:hypothetical protein